LAICTENLPNSPASKPSDHFKALKYTGNGTSSNEVTGVGFRPDLVWIKGTEAGYDWGCWDTNRGKHSRQILSSGGAAETQTNFASFDNDGFSVASGNLVNQDTKVYHAYCWKAGASAKSNTDGSTVAHVSANQAAGFSIVKWFGTNGNHTVGHGLLRAPEYIIAKDIDRTDQYRVGHQYYHATTPWTYNTALSQPLAPWANNNVWNQTAPTDTVVALGDELTQNSAHRGIAYCWHSVDGYSKIGLYYGNGSTDGPFVYCGFKPAYLWMKNIDSGTENFAVLDNATNPSNVANTMSFWGETDADQTHDVNRVDFLSNGFKIRGNDARWNTDNARYAFVAFAEQPQKYATAR